MLGPMTREELRAAIEKPAEAQGAAFEAGLVERLLDDVGKEPGNLPLLEFALTLLWERLDFGWLTHAAYEAIGRVEGALARYADEVYGALAAEEQALARRIFTQLVQPGEGTEDTRRVATRADVGDAAWALVAAPGGPAAGGDGARRGHGRRDGGGGARGADPELGPAAGVDGGGPGVQDVAGAAARARCTRGRARATTRVRCCAACRWRRRRSGCGRGGTSLSETERAFVEAGHRARERRAAEREAQRQAELEAARQLPEAHDVALRQAAIGLAAEARNQMQGPNQDVAAVLALEAVEALPLHLAGGAGAGARSC